MKNKFLVVFVLIIIYIICLVSVAACEKIVDIPYDLQESDDTALKNSVTLYDDAILWMKDEYVYANRTSPLPDADDCPEEITNIITSQEEFDKAFDSFPVGINWEDEMLVLHFFTDENIISGSGKRARYYELSDVEKNGNEITFICYRNKTMLRDPDISDNLIKDQGSPAQICLLFLMPKISNVDFRYEITTVNYYETWNGDLADNTTLYDADLEWLREEYVKEVSTALESSYEVIVKIQNREKYVKTFKKFYNSFDVDDEMLVLCFIKQDDNDANEYEYLISDIQYGEGYLDIDLNKKVKEAQSKDDAYNMTFLVIRLPQLPAYNVNIKIK